MGIEEGTLMFAFNQDNNSNLFYFILQLSHLAVVFAQLSDETRYTTPSDKDIHHAGATILSAMSGDHKLRVRSGRSP
jgi:hypothetical protein